MVHPIVGSDLSGTLLLRVGCRDTGGEVAVYVNMRTKLFYLNCGLILYSEGKVHC